MATILTKGKHDCYLDFTLGSVLILKSTKFPFSTSKQKEIQVDLYNANGDTLLSIAFDTKYQWYPIRHKIRFNSRGRSSFHDQEVGTSHWENFEKWRKSGVTISVHHYPTDSKFGNYQILLDDATVCNFEKEFPGPAMSIAYMGSASLGPKSWTVSVCRVSDLGSWERRFLARHRWVILRWLYLLLIKRSDLPLSLLQFLGQYTHPSVGKTRYVS